MADPFNITNPSDLSAISPEMAQMLLSSGGSRRQTPRNVGEGLDAIGQDIRDAVKFRMLYNAMAGNAKREQSALGLLSGVTAGSPNPSRGTPAGSPSSEAVSATALAPTKVVAPAVSSAGPEPEPPSSAQIFMGAAKTKPSAAPSGSFNQALKPDSQAAAPYASVAKPAVAPSADADQQQPSAFAPGGPPPPKRQQSYAEQFSSGLQTRIARIDQEIAKHQQVLAALPAGSRYTQMITSRLSGLQDQRAKLDDPLTHAELAIKARELDSPKGQLTTVPDGGTLVETDPRTGQAKIIVKGDGKAASGYSRIGSDERGNPIWQAIPGGPADIKLNEKRQQDYAALQSMFQSLDSLASQANQVKEHKGLSGNFGVSGYLPNFPGGQSADAAALLDTLRTKSAFTTLQDMRNSSKSGGALGAVSDKETVMLQNAIAALSKSQSVGQTQQQLAAIIDYVEKAKHRLRDAYDTAWNGSNGSPGIRGGQGNSSPAQSSLEKGDAPQETKTIDGVTYYKIRGKWYH